MWTFRSVLRRSVYLLAPWCGVLLEKLTGLQLVKKFPAFHGTRRFITALTSVCHLSLSWASPIQSIYPHPTWRSVLILSTHLRLDLPSGVFPSGFPTKTLYTPPPHPYAPHAQPISISIPHEKQASKCSCPDRRKSAQSSSIYFRFILTPSSSSATAQLSSTNTTD